MTDRKITTADVQQLTMKGYNAAKFLVEQDEKNPDEAVIAGLLASIILAKLVNPDMTKERFVEVTRSAYDMFEIILAQNPELASLFPQAYSGTVKKILSRFMKSKKP